MSELQKRFRVGIRLPEWSTGFAFRLFEGLLDFQRQDAPFQLVFNQPSGGDLAPLMIDESWDGDGLIVFRYSEAEARAWKDRGVAVVNLSAEVAEDSPMFPQVTMDNAACGRMAAEHLASLGLRDFCYIHESTRRYSDERLKSFKAAVKSHGGRFHQIDVPVSSYPASSCPKKIEKAIWLPLANLPRPCGIFTKDDIAAVWTMLTLAKLGIRCPDEMPVLGVDDDVFFCHTTQPPLSSIAYPGRTIGYEAARMMHRMLTGSLRRTHQRIAVRPPGVVCRESTRHVILNDVVTTKALAFIRAEITSRCVSVSEVARHCGVSRELLRQRFNEVLNLSPKSEIERLRMRHLTELLRTTNWTLDGIAESCGFSGSDEVCRFVKRNTGKTPGEWRKAPGHTGLADFSG